MSLQELSHGVPLWDKITIPLGGAVAAALFNVDSATKIAALLIAVVTLATAMVRLYIAVHDARQKRKDSEES